MRLSREFPFNSKNRNEQFRYPDLMTVVTVCNLNVQYGPHRVGETYKARIHSHTILSLVGCPFTIVENCCLDGCRLKSERISSAPEGFPCDDLKCWESFFYAEKLGREMLAIEINCSSKSSSQESYWFTS